MARPQPARRRDQGSHDLERLLSKAGLCSRGVARTWIAAGRVQVDGQVVRDPWARFPAGARITVDRQALPSAAKVYLALHKPRGYVTTRVDPQGRRTIYDLVTVEPWVAPVGRLDRDSSGLLILTNDTALAESVTNPQSHVPKTYLIEAAPRLTEPALQQLRDGIDLADGRTRPATVQVLAMHGPCSVLELTISEGRNRQVRRMVSAVGSRVRRLKRTAIGAVALGDLPAGHWRHLTAAEVRALKPSPKRDDPRRAR